MDQKSKNKEYLRLAIVVVVLFAILGGFLLYVSYPLLSTTTAVLSTRPVDPFDLVRGQYITINYDISSIPPINGARVGDAVYVILEKDENGVSQYKSASLDKPSRNNLFIRGDIRNINGVQMIVGYGIEQYFFERNAKFETRDLQVKVKLSDSGVARISELLRNGKPIEMTYENKSFKD